MPRPDSYPTGAPCWIDLATSDADRARAFYAAVFGWTADEPAEEFGGYFNFREEGAMVAGCIATEPGSGVPDMWSIYLTTDDITKAVEAVTANGGTVLYQPMAVADLGSMAIVTDPGGARVGLWQPGRHRGFEVVEEGGTPTWFELLTRDYDKSVEFYRAVFGVETQDFGDGGDFRYTVVKDGDRQVAGIMDASGFLPEGTPGQWSVYIRVDDADARLARVTDNGGQVVRPAEDTPYGRLATAADPMGAQIKLLGPNREAPAGSPAG